LVFRRIGHSRPFAASAGQSSSHSSARSCLLLLRACAGDGNQGPAEQVAEVPEGQHMVFFQEGHRRRDAGLPHPVRRLIGLSHPRRDRRRAGVFFPASTGCSVGCPDEPGPGSAVAPGRLMAAAALGEQVVAPEHRDSSWPSVPPS
jgi:hypothetical protein